VQVLFEILELEEGHNTMKLPDISIKIKSTFISVMRFILVSFNI
jgi:hypothetical protein